MPLELRGANPYISSGQLTANAAIKTSKGFLGGVFIITNGTNDATVILFDNASAATGKRLFRYVVAGGDNNEYIPQFKHFKNGCYARVAGVGASYIVDYF